MGWFRGERGLPEDRYPAAGGPLQAEDHPQQRRLARAVGADQPGELPGVDGEADIVEDLPPRQA